MCTSLCQSGLFCLQALWRRCGSWQCACIRRIKHQRRGRSLQRTPGKRHATRCLFLLRVSVHWPAALTGDVSGAQWQPTREGYLRFLTESKAVYETLERIVAEASHSECTPHCSCAASVTLYVAVAGCGLAA